MKIIKKIQEGESLTGSIIGYKYIKYMDFDRNYISAIKITIYLGFLLIKFECIPLWQEKK